VSTTSAARGPATTQASTSARRLLLVLALGLVIQPFVGAAAALVLGVVSSSGARERTALFALALLLALYGTAFSFIPFGIGGG